MPSTSSGFAFHFHQSPFLRLLFTALLLSLSPSLRLAVAEVCTSTCEAEFKKCVSSRCLSQPTSAYATCRSELTAARGPLAKACPLPSCVFTSGMSGLQSSPCSQQSRQTERGAVCGQTPASKPTTPTACDAATNQGCCSCLTASATQKTYVWWIGSMQYCLHTYVPASAPQPKPFPVMLASRGYGGGSTNLLESTTKTAAERYGFAVIVLSSWKDDGRNKFGLEFPNDGIIPTAAGDLTPCSSAYSRDYDYVKETFDFIASQTADLDPSRVFVEGFSQNSMWSLYVATCFSSKVQGVWQGGSGLARTAWHPVTPGWESVCTETAYHSVGTPTCCNAANFCPSCKFWPIYPRTCPSLRPENKIVDCIAMTGPAAGPTIIAMMTADNMACGTDWYAFNAMVAEGNDARLLSFNSCTGNNCHKNPDNDWAWKVGCLGVAPPCSAQCETTFLGCAAGQTPTTGPTTFDHCETLLHNGGQTGCNPGCAPTLGMLMVAEPGAVVSLSEGKFGNTTGLTITPSAPKPLCTGVTVDSFAVEAHAQCVPPGNVAFSGVPAAGTLACGVEPDPAVGDSNSNVDQGNQNQATSTTQPGTSGAANACPSECETEFVSMCIPDKCQRGESSEQAFATCKSQLERGRMPIANKCPTATCSFTAAMTAAELTGCDQNQNQNNQPQSTPAQVVPSASRPTSPTLCDNQNKGSCKCATPDSTTKTFVWWIGEMQYCLHTYVPTAHPTGSGRSSAASFPVMIGSRGYGGGNFNVLEDETKEAADRYGFAVVIHSSHLKDGRGGFGLQFPNQDVIPTAAGDLTPCSAADSRDYEYVKQVFHYIRDNGSMDHTKVFIEGFSQNSMWSLYVATCFPTRIRGVWQGGSGMMRTGFLPIPPGKQSTCDFPTYQITGAESACCSETNFCRDCRFWPIYPRTCPARNAANKLIVCEQAYTADSIACGSDWYAYEALRLEGNDPRLLSFPNGRHAEPPNSWAWKVGCLGVVPTCSSACEARFLACSNYQTGSTVFAKCESELHSGWFAPDCVPGCAPTLNMLLVSESDSQGVVVSLSEGKFGGQTGLEVAAAPAPKPACANGFGTFAEMTGKTECVAPANLVSSFTGLPDPESTMACPTAKSGARVRARFTLTERLPASITTGEQLMQETTYVNAKKVGIANSLPGATEDNVLITGFDVVSASSRLLEGKKMIGRALATASRSVTTHFEVTGLDSAVATSIEEDLAASSVRTALAAQITAQMATNSVTVAGETVSVTSTSATGVSATADSGSGAGSGGEDDDDVLRLVAIAGIGLAGLAGIVVILLLCKHKLCSGTGGKTAPQ